MSRFSGSSCRMRMTCAVILVLCLVWPLAGQAQPGAAGGGDGAAVAQDPAWLLYDQAFERLAAGEGETARVLLETLRDQFPDHPAAREAARRLAEGSADAPDGPGDAAGGPVVTPGKPPKAAGREPRTMFARGELALFMTLHGVLTTQRICSMLDCSSARAYAASTMLGGGAGLGLSLYFSRRGVTPGQALLMNSAMTWGAWNGAGFTEFGDSTADAAAVVASQAIGLGIGMGIWYAGEPTAGEVAMANTAGFWSAMLTLMAHGLFSEEPALETVVVASDIGLVLGGFLASRIDHLSRGRSLIIDAGGILGFLAGGLVAIVSDADNETAVFAPLILGTGAGLGLAAYATRRWDVPDLPANAAVTLSPMGQGGWGASVFWQWE